MTSSIVDAESVLAVEIGSTHTRAMLFDVVDGQYRFIASGSAQSTAQAPFFDVSEGVFNAIKRLREATGREFFDSELHLIQPSTSTGDGVDQFIVTYSAGPSLRMVTLGLLEDVSLESANRLAASLPGEVYERIGMNDIRQPEQQVDALLQAKPDVIILAGGTEGGATRTVSRLSDLISLTLQVLPKEKRPEILFTGNQALAKHIQDALEPLADVEVASNVRPTIDQEDLTPAMQTASNLVSRLSCRRLNGLQNVAHFGSTPPVPTSYAFGRMIRFLSQVYNRSKGVLGIDLGGSHTILAGACQGRLSMVNTDYGMGDGMLAALQKVTVEEIAQWLPDSLPVDVVRDYLHNKSLFPTSVAADEESLAIEHALARSLIRLAVQEMNIHWPGLGMMYEPIIASGLTFTQGARPGQSLLMLLDGLQPVGISTIVLDAYGLLPSLGALAQENAMLPVQIIESNAFVNLGTVIAPISQARYGTPIMNVRLEYERGEKTQIQVKQGSLTTLPLRNGQIARIHLEPLRSMQIDPSRKDKAPSFKIVGGLCGAVIDARGRPLVLPEDEARRRDLIKTWTTVLN